MPSSSLARRVAGPAGWGVEREAVERGLKYLLGQQLASGAVGSRHAVAVTSLAGLAVLGAGHLPGQAPYGPMLEKCAVYLEGCAGASGFINEPGEGESRMHGHAYAVLFLSELLGSLPPEREGDVLDLVRRGVRVIENAQSKEGGWFYTAGPTPEDDEASVTVCALQALRAARNAGVAVDSSVIERAISYVERCQQPVDGSFAYSIKMKWKTSYALTVAALSTLNAAGVYRSRGVHRGLEYVTKRIDAAPSPWDAAEEEYDFYANLYAAQALYQDGRELWARWFPSVRERLLSRQKRAENGQGYWECRFGEEFATAVAILILEVPVGYLPIFQR